SSASRRARPEARAGRKSVAQGLAYRRVLVKMSGEALAGASEYGIDDAVLQGFANEIRDVHALGIEIAVVIGGGNIFRGLSGTKHGIERATADYMGMLA